MELSVTTSLVEEIMADFARATGLEPLQEEPRRYLWTDAFAVCNYLELFRQTGDLEYRQLAAKLVDQVHHVLGKHRADGTRKGWISGLDEDDGEEHPTVGGLRIGKPLNERGPDERADPRLEWEQDGQYFHYLTKWMHALNQMGQVTGEPMYASWTMELASTAHAAFAYAPVPGGRKRMYWKKSIDLTYPLVPSMGQHDPLDGYVTFNELQLTAKGFGETVPFDLHAEIHDMAEICRGTSLVTDDPLGIGGLLFDAARIVQLAMKGGMEDAALAEKALGSALTGLRAFTSEGSINYPAEYRLAFRELGLSIGLHGVPLLQNWTSGGPGRLGGQGSLSGQLEALRSFLPYAESIEKFWSDRRNWKATTWTGHRDINMVMLATSLAPRTFLVL